MTKTIIPLLFIAFLFMAACHNFDEPKKNAFITNARIMEDGETLTEVETSHPNTTLTSKNGLRSMYPEHLTRSFGLINMQS